MTFALALTIAASWWGALGHTLPAGCQPTEQISTVDPHPAWVYAGSCVIYVQPGTQDDPYEFCRAIVHEYGHLAGLSHPAVPEPGNIMNGDSREMWPDVPDCTRQGPVKGVVRDQSPPRARATRRARRFAAQRFARGTR